MQRNKTRLRQLLGREIRLRPSISIDTVRDADWCYDASVLDAHSVVYSLGVGDTIEFDLALIERTGATVHAFDPTPGTYATLAANALPDQFRFHPWAVAAEDGTLSLYPRVRKDGSLSEMMYTLVPDPASESEAIQVPAYTIDSIATQLGHMDIDLVKMDIEGAEYDVITGLLAGDLRPRHVDRRRQLLEHRAHLHHGRCQGDLGLRVRRPDQDADVVTDAFLARLEIAIGDDRTATGNRAVQDPSISGICTR